MAFFSIIIPVYHHASGGIDRLALLNRALASVMRQSFSDYIVFVIDDGSKQKKCVEKVVAGYGSNRFHYVRKRHGGVASARNAGIKLSLLSDDVSWLAFLDSDDEWHVDKLQEQFLYIKQNKEVAIFQTDDVWVRNGKQVQMPLFLSKIGGVVFDACLKRCMVSPSSFVMQPCVVQDVGYFRSNLPACEDYDFFLRVSLKYSIGLLDKKLITRYQGHRGQLSFQHRVMDRFRIRALVSLYKEMQIEGRFKQSKQNTFLHDDSLLVDRTEAQKKIRAEIIKRARIVYKGAFKRRIYKRALYYFFVYHRHLAKKS